MITFEVFGIPQPAGSKRGFPLKLANSKTRVIITDANPKAKGWKAHVQDAARSAYTGTPLDCPLQVQFTFILTRPKGHYGSGKNSSLVKPSAPRYPTVKPDCLKLSRGVEDALTGLIWRDDSLIVQEVLIKEYGDIPKCVVTISPMP